MGKKFFVSFMIEEFLICGGMNSLEHVVNHWVTCNFRDSFAIVTCWRECLRIQSQSLAVICTMHHVHLVNVFLKPFIITVLLKIISKHFLVQEDFVYLLVQLTFLLAALFLLRLRKVVVLHQQIVHIVMVHVLVIWWLISINCFYLRFV